MPIDTENVILKLITCIDERSAREADDYRKMVEKPVEVDADTSKAKKGFEGIRVNLKKLGAAAAGIGLTSFLADASTEAIRLAGNFETTLNNFTTLLQDGNLAKKLLEDLADIEAGTPFTLTELQDATQTLLSFGGTSETVIDDVQALGEIASATGNNLNDLSVIFGQVQAKQKLQGEEALQLLERGIPIYDLIGDSLGVTANEARKLQEAGKVSFDVLRQGILDSAEAGGRFEGSLKRQAETYEGLQSTLQGVRDAILRAFGERTLNNVKGVLRFLIQAGNALKDFIATPVAPEIERTVQALEEEKNSLNALVGSITETNISEEERVRLINQLNTEYPNFLKNIDAESASNDVLINRLKEVNKQFVVKIALSRQEDKLNKLREEGGAKVSQSLDLEAEARQKLAEIRTFAGLSEDAEQAESFTQRINRTIDELGTSRQQLTFLTEQQLLQEGSVDAGRATSLRLLQRLISQEARYSALRNIGLGIGKQAAEQQDIVNQIIRENNLDFFDNVEAVNASTSASSKNAAALLAQAGSVRFLEDQISKLNKRIQNTDVDSPTQVQFAVDLDKLEDELEVAKQRLASLREQEVVLDLKFNDSNPFLDDPNFQGIDLKAEKSKLESDLARLANDEALIREDLFKDRELSEQEREDRLTQLQLENLNKRREILKNSLASTVTDVINVSVEIAELEAKASEKRRDIANKVKDDLVSFANDILQANIDRVNQEIQIQEGRLDSIRDIASRGNAEQLELEEERLRKLQEQRERAIAKQRQLAAIEIAVNNAVALSAAIKAITEGFGSGSLVGGLLIAASVAATVGSTIATLSSAFGDIPSFFVGTERVQGGRHQGTLIQAHGDERILNHKDNAPLLKMGVKNKDIPRLVAAGMQYERVPTMSKDLMFFSNRNQVSTEKMEKQNSRLIKQNAMILEALAQSSMNVNIDQDGIFLANRASLSREVRKQRLRR